MDRHAPTRRLIPSRCFTLVEMMACTAILLIMALALGPAIVGAQRNAQNTYDSVTAGLARDGRAARIVLQRVARRASLQNVTIGPDSDWIELPYYDSSTSTQMDRYARLTWSNGCLNLREGQIDSQGTRQMLTEAAVCDSVSNYVFARSGTSIRMKLAFTQGTTQMTIAAAAVTNNK